MTISKIWIIFTYFSIDETVYRSPWSFTASSMQWNSTDHSCVPSAVSRLKLMKVNRMPSVLSAQIVTRDTNLNIKPRQKNMLYPYNGILSSNKKKCTIDTVQKLDVRWTKADSKSCILYDSIYVIFWKRQNYINQNTSVVTREWRRRRDYLEGARR